ncbi:hypothetical protein [Rhodococcus sp. SGAir0479]|uniref:hypothetical protein n=1 Tax=Rhodococcus sp. SGAir0479 TaxID=2567884 RepID=UPI0010CCB5CB|nr:hypothetical protein [Rhodococcus sp. SGAir0479]QCQ93468.1 hypothetical protein E7742_21115 [Rhodococcus sp. SGAir0479]
MIVGVATDSGFSSRLAEAVSRRIPAWVADVAGCDPDDVAVEDIALPLPPGPDGLPAVDDWYTAAAVDGRFDIVLVFSEMPRSEKGRVLVAEIVGSDVAVFYTPALGVLRAGRRAQEIVEHTLVELLGESEHGRTPPQRRLVWAADDSGARRRLLYVAPFARPRLLAGMIRGNRPWRLVPTLSGAFGAASAASAFGIFYASIWQMAVAMSVFRLVLVSLAATVAMSLWLILPNGLWERRVFRSARSDRVLYNSATVGTVVAGVLCMYALLLVAVLVTAFVVVPENYLAAQLESTVSAATYIRLAWLAASLGIVAGAVGSSAADKTEILRATYGRREVERREMVGRQLRDTATTSDAPEE